MRRDELRLEVRDKNSKQKTKNSKVKTDYGGLASAGPRHSYSGCKKGFNWRSFPMVVTGPWPGYTTVSSGRCINLVRSESRICSMEPPHRSVRPLLPATSVSP